MDEPPRMSQSDRLSHLIGPLISRTSCLAAHPCKAQGPRPNPRLARLLVSPRVASAPRHVVQLAAAGGDFVSGQVSHRAGEPRPHHARDRAARAGATSTSRTGTTSTSSASSCSEHGCPTENIFFHHIKTNESWCRDHGPAFVLRKTTRQDATRRRSSTGASTPGAGSIRRTTTTTRCRRGSPRSSKLPVFYPGDRHGRRRRRVQRRRHRPDHHRLPAQQEPQPAACPRPQIEQYLKDYYGQKHVVWLGDGIDGRRHRRPHRRPRPVHQPDARSSSASRTTRRTRTTESSRTTRSGCEKLRDQDGQPFEIVEIPMPGAVEHDGQRLPATYVNFYFVNGALLVPTYRRQDERPQGAGDPPAAPAEAQGDRHRLRRS